jgi:DNA-binding GntR family transcriptional regulator
LQQERKGISPRGQVDLGDIDSVLPQKTFQEQAYNIIKTAIVTGHVSPGDVLSAKFVAGELGISGTPVREALIRLSHKGFVEPVRNRGFRVLQVTAKELDDIFEVRSLLEPWAVGKGTERISKQALREASSLVGQMAAVAAQVDLAEFLRLDTEFHLLLAGASGNATLAGIVGELRERMHLHGLERIAREGGLTAVAESHRQLLEAVAGGRCEEASKLTLEHLQNTRTTWAD